MGAEPSEENSRLRNWQRLIVSLMIVGYAGYYLCRSNLSIATPLLIDAFKGQGLDKEAIGAIASFGTLCYAIGKFFGGTTADYLGGRRVFMVGMGGAVLFTLLFGFGGPPLFLTAWCLNRFIQSVGWAGMVKITSRWFSYSAYGTAMGLISLSYLFGDFLSRQFLGKLVENGVGWQGLFQISAGTLAVIFVVTLILLRESPKIVGLPEPAASPTNLYGKAGQVETPVSFAQLMGPVFRSPLFWTVCLLSLGFTLVRETFNTWTPQYLHEVVGMEKGAAGRASSYFPLFGGISVLCCGFLSDKIGRAGRSSIILGGLILSVPALLLFAFLDLKGSGNTAILLLGGVAFLMLGPYSFLAGAISLDFGGKRGSATVCGWVDGVGYLGGVLAGKGIGAIAERAGWKQAFLTLAGVAVLSIFAAVLYLLQTLKSGRATME